MTNYPQELAQDAVCQSYTGHMTGLWFLPARPLRLNANERTRQLFLPMEEKCVSSDVRSKSLYFIIPTKFNL